ncbi:MAG: hypothetical protein WBG08_12940 [Litorimonas sp.]
MSNPVIETVLFELEDGVSDADFRATLPASTAFIESCPGFLRRCLSASGDGQWIDHIEWADMASAKAAAARIGQDETVHPFVSKISGPSVRMHHTETAILVEASASD